MSEYLLEINNVSKSFPGVKALDNVSLKLKSGSVHAVMGENGAGKSTLMKCLFGIYEMDEGEIIFEGKKINIRDTRDALDKGIAMIHQELQPILERSVAENIFIGKYPTKKIGPFTIIDHEKMYLDTEKLLKEVRMNFKATDKLSTLSVSQMQSVEIAKAVSENAKVIIMDEPTSSLTNNEVEALFEIINDLRDKGCGIIYISHKMDEILKISDDITILRDGEYVGTWPAKMMTMNSIITNMVGRELKNMYPPKTNSVGKIILEVRNFTSINPLSFKNVSFDLREGEVLGFGGLVGAQRTELLEAIFGIRKIKEGTLKYKGKPLQISRPEDAIKNKIALLTEDRRASGIFGVLTIKDNISVASLDNYINIKPFINNGKIKQVVIDSVKQLNIKTPSINTLIQNLSGGNQQKVLLARWLSNNPDILILDEPTRGIDVGAKYEIYTIINKLAEEGKSIIMISSELPELLGMADRIAVMSEGRLTGVLNKDEATQESIMELAAQF